MKIFLVSSEVYPFSRTGMLGDSVASLAKGLKANGTDIFVISPMYLTVCTDEERYEKVTDVTVFAGEKNYSFEVYKTVYEGITYFFMRNDALYGRRCIYGSGDYDYSDNDIRFGIFSLAVVEFIDKNEPDTDVIHCHEWQTGLVPVYKNLYYKNLKAKTVFTVHDINYQGIFDKFSLTELGLPWDVYNIEELEYYENISMLKGGIAHSDFVTVPSPNYAQEIKNEELTSGLGAFIEANSHKLEGIICGIDYDRFSPENNIHIAKQYDSENIRDKKWNKEKFLEESGLDNSDLPLMLLETKFSQRKGLELILNQSEKLAELPVNFAFFGYGDTSYCAKFKEIAQKYNNMYTFIGISESMVQLAYAAADFVIRPSVYEPCGKSHLIGMRFGALPIVRRTGGHADTVTDIDGGGIGFMIKDYSRQELFDQILRAIDFFNDKDIFNKCASKAMKADFSLHILADNYMNLYQRLLGGK
jgi:starch synthase